MITSLRQKFGNYYFIVIIGGASILTGTINYLYHPMMIRYLNGADFAIFQSLMSLFNIFGVIGAGLSYYLTQQVSINAYSNSYLTYIKTFGLRIAKYRGIGLFLFFCALSPAIMLYLHLPSVYLVFLVASSYLVTGYSIVYGALLHGNNKFEYVAGVMIWSSIRRVLLGAIAMYLDLGIAGAIAAVSIGSLFGTALQYFLARNIGTTPQETYTGEKPLEDPLYNHKGTILFFIAASFLTMLLTQIDIFIVQHKFFGEQAGNYVAVSILAKFVFFLAGSIQTVYYPQLAKNKAHNVSRIQLRNYFLLLMLLILVSLGGAWLFGTYVLFLFKAHLVAYSGWLQPLIISSGALFFFTTIFKLLISRQEFSRAYLLIGVGILSMIRLHFAPSTLDSFVPLYMRTMIALCLGAAGCFLSVLGKKNTSN